MKLSYNKIFKQALRITVQHKFLWIFGLFLSVSSLYFAYLGMPNSLLDSSNFWMIVSSILYIGFLILNFRSLSGLIIAIMAVTDKQPTSFSKSFSAARLFYARVFGFFVFVLLAAGALGLLLGIPILFLFNHHMDSRAIILSILGFILFVPAFVIGSLVLALAPLFIVVYDLKIKEAASRSFELALQHWPRLILFLIVLGIIDIPALFLGQFVLEFRGGALVSIIGAAVFLLVQTWYSVFQQASWFSVFSDLVRPEKIEEEEVVSAPAPIVE